MFHKRGKAVSKAYLFSLLAALHYPYIYGWKGVLIWVLFIAVSVLTWGIVGVIWWLVDFFRLPGMVRDNNLCRCS